jgi:cyclophilin family peptidyl-prolyl cis-trans isomerase
MSPRRSNRRKISKKPHSKKLPLAIGLLAVTLIVIVAVTMFYVLGTNNTPTGDRVLLKTSMGDITIQLRDGRPITTSNFMNLVQNGVYDGTIFHRIIPGVLIQGGDPTGTGYGDPSIPTIQDELGGDNQNLYGTVAMAKKFDSETGKSVPNSASSQFFINLADNHDFDAEYSVFGDVISGMNVVYAISQVATDANDRPLFGVTLIDAEIIS